MTQPPPKKSPALQFCLGLCFGIFGLCSAGNPALALIILPLSLIAFLVGFHFVIEKQRWDKAAFPLGFALGVWIIHLIVFLLVSKHGPFKVNPYL